MRPDSLLDRKGPLVDVSRPVIVRNRPGGERRSGEWNVSRRPESGPLEPARKWIRWESRACPQVIEAQEGLLEHEVSDPWRVRHAEHHLQLLLRAVKAISAADRGLAIAKRIVCKPNSRLEVAQLAGCASRAASGVAGENQPGGRVEVTLRLFSRNPAGHLTAQRGDRQEGVVSDPSR